MMSILQENLNRNVLAQNLLRQRVFEDNTDVCIICEQHSNLEDKTWFTDETNTAAIWTVSSNNVTIINSGCGARFVWIKTSMTYIMSVYLSPNEGISAFRQKLSNIEDAINDFNGEVIVAGDFNAKSAEWGAVFSNTRGNKVADFAARLDLTVLNTGNTSTFRRPGYQEYILDISLGIPRIARMIKNWIDHEALRKSLSQSWSTLKLHPAPNTRSETERLVLTVMKAITTSGRHTGGRQKFQHFVKDVTNFVVE
ncbi:unnamed protein product [Euphydryas editha]|uniref:Endonuclease/exonuclease/phosphatase domain-containing protein n=1 Tax=Euphydryas editha TaxID=104508 RepID=A0AAU9VAT9_EUPED|nr:unnamed protein product [Euphydryas editha]